MTTSILYLNVGTELIDEHFQYVLAIYDAERALTRNFGGSRQYGLQLCSNGSDDFRNWDLRHEITFLLH